jgi:hypothetical protein
LLDLALHIGFPDLIALFQEPQTFTDDLASGFIISNSHLLADKFFHRVRQRNVHLWNSPQPSWTSNFDIDVQLKSPFAESDVSLIPYSLRLLGPLLTEFSRKASYRVYISFLDEIL